ncbi:MAG: GNAT family N-acetyltransferase [Lautropia sp.]|nr:GNAT family N-acetyltransferase [Lautropia sp.]
MPAQAGVVDPQRTEATLQWRCSPFEAVPPALLYRALALRSSVFVVEQRCIYQDLDGSDLRALLVTGSLCGMPVSRAHEGPWGAGSDADVEVVATARVLPPGSRYAEPSIGRVCTSAAHRRLGLGRMLMTYAIGVTREHHPGLAIRISAQAYLQAFYASLGFEPVSQPYLEDGIAHLQMRLSPG